MPSNLNLKILFCSEYLFSFLLIGIAASWFTYFSPGSNLDAPKLMSILGALYAVSCSFPIVISYGLDNVITDQGRVFLGFLLESIGFFILSIYKLQYIEISLSVIILGYTLGRPILPVLIYDTDPSNISKNKYFLYMSTNLAHATAPFVFGFLAPERDQYIFLLASVITFFMAILVFKNENLKILSYIKIFLMCIVSIYTINFVLTKDVLLICYFCLLLVGTFFTLFSFYSGALQDRKEDCKEILFMFLIGFVLFSLISQIFFLCPIYIEHNITMQVFNIMLQTPWFLAINPLFIIIWSLYCGKKIIKLNYSNCLIYVCIGFMCLFLSTFTSSHIAVILVGISYVFFTYSELKLIPGLIEKISSWQDTNITNRRKLMAVFYMIISFSKIAASVIARIFINRINVNYREEFTIIFGLLALVTLILQICFFYWSYIRRQRSMACVM